MMIISLLLQMHAAALIATAPVAPQASPCDASLWKRVYNPTRLTQVKACIVATGVIEESNVDPDGDQHFLMKLDKGESGLLNKRNEKKKQGDLVVEIVCANPVKLKKVAATCVGFKNTVMVPAVGAHVRVTGTYVIDGHNGWAEIHPASRIELVK